MPFMQPKVTPLPAGIDLKGKTAVVTGATAGLGLEVSRQLLKLGITTLVMAVRNVMKGEGISKSLLAEPTIREINPAATVKVMRLDTDDYSSVLAFAKSVKSDIPAVDLLFLNAGICLAKFERSSSGHERSTQVNYLSNVLLLLELLPVLEATASQTGRPSRVTWVGSRMQGIAALAKEALDASSSVFGYLDDESKYSIKRYGDTKLLCTMFVYDISKHISSEKVVLNIVCPGAIDTGFSDDLPIYLRILADVVKKLRARPVEQGAWILNNAAVVVGPDSHGKFIADKTIDSPSEFIVSPAGRELQQKLWRETMQEVSKYTSLSPELMKT